MSAVQQRVVQFGLTEVWSTPEQPLVDVVFVHGLNGHPYVSVRRIIASHNTCTLGTCGPGRRLNLVAPGAAENDVLISLQNTWATHKPTDVFWPTDLLPGALQDLRCRILTYGYDAQVTAFSDGASKDKIHNHAEHLASRLVANRSVRGTYTIPAGRLDVLYNANSCYSSKRL